MNKQRQSDLILNYLTAGNTLTALEALDRFGCFRLASRISDLKKEGHDIHVKIIKLSNGKHCAEYWIQTKIEYNNQYSYNLI